MGWVKLDDGFFLHPKAVAAGRDARTLFLSALCWSNQQMTDGVIPASSLPLVAALAGVSDFEQAATRLVEVGLWHNHVDGWEIHQFLGRQQSKAEREAWLEKERERKAKAAQKRRDEMTPKLVEPSARNPDGIRGLSAASKSKSKSKSQSSSEGVQGEISTPPAPDDDDGRIRAITDRIGQRKAARAPVKSNRSGLIRTCKANAYDELGDDVAQLLTEGHDPDTIIERLDPDPNAPKPPPPPVERCDECEMPVNAGHLRDCPRAS